MKRTIILSIILVVISMILVIIAQSVIIDEGTPTTITLPSLTIEDSTIDQSDEVGNPHSEHSLSNLTDGNDTTYVKTTNNQTFYYINFTKINDSTSSTKVQIKYNTSSGSVTTNYTLSDYPNCFEQDSEKVLIRLNSNYTQNFSNSVTYESFTWLNGTAVSLTNTRISSIVVFNATSNVTVGVNNYTLDYLSGNITLISDYHNNTIFKSNYTYMTDATPSNDRECYNGTNWISLGIDTGQPEIFDIRLFWNVASRLLNFSFSGLTPNAYSIRNLTTVMINITTIDYAADNNHTYWNCSLYNRSNRDYNYSVNSLLDDRVVTNGSYFNQSITFDDNSRTWWYISCEDEYGREIANSTVRLFDIDVYYIKLKIQGGVINFTITDGSAQFQGNVKAPSFTGAMLTLDNLTTISSCDAARNGDLVYNATPHKLLFCNSTDWQRLN